VDTFLVVSPRALMDGRLNADDISSFSELLFEDRILLFCLVVAGLVSKNRDGRSKSCTGHQKLILDRSPRARTLYYNQRERS
jgi:hypothetical protein